MDIPSHDESTAGRGHRALIGLAALVVVVAGLRAAAPVLVPFALSVVLTVTLMPVVGALRRLRVPFVPAILITMVATLGALAALASLVIESLRQIQLALPRYIERLSEMERSLADWLYTRGIPLETSVWQDLVQPDRLVAYLGGTLREVASFTTFSFLVGIITVFILIEASRLPPRLRAVFGEHDMHRFGRIVSEIQRYLAIKTAISLATGLLVGLWGWNFGLDFPLLWGLLAFVLNYVPNVGSVVAAIPAILLALVQLGPGGAAGVAAGYLGVNILLGSIIEPHVVGRGLGLSPLVVILSLLFWGFVLGPVGMLLSLPLTMMLKIVLENTSDFRHLAHLFGPASEESAPSA